VAEEDAEEEEDEALRISTEDGKCTSYSPLFDYYLWYYAEE
jgi:hypothetical protein